MSHPFALTSRDGQEVYLSAGDLAAYDWARHRLALRPGVKQRLLRDLAGDLATGREFAVVADGRAVYEGVFTSSMSSKSHHGVVIDLAPLDDVADEIELRVGYPSRDFFRGPDPRDHPAIRAALTGANLLR